MLEVRISLTVGNYRFDQHCVALRLRRTRLPALDRLEVFLPAATAFKGFQGDDCSLDIDGGDGQATVFSGLLSNIRRDIDGLHLVAHNGGLTLARYRPTVAFEQMSVSDIINALCSDVGVGCTTQLNGATLTLYVAEGRATAAQEIARLAGLAGAGGAFDGQGVLTVAEEGGPGGELALKYGREIISAAGGQFMADQTTYTVVGEGGGAPSSSQGRWIIADFLKGSGEEPGPAARRIVEPELRTLEDARQAAAAIAHRTLAAQTPIRLRLWLNPHVEPGMRLELAEMPAHAPMGECRVSQLVSTFAPAGVAVTDIWASGQVEGASALSGLLGAVGGLL